MRLIGALLIGAVAGYATRHYVIPAIEVAYYNESEDGVGPDEEPAMTLFRLTRPIGGDETSKVVTALWYHNREALESMGVYVKEYYK